MFRRRRRRRTALTLLVQIFSLLTCEVKAKCFSVTLDGTVQGKGSDY